MNNSFKDKLRYKFERYINRGGASIFTSLFMVFFCRVHLYTRFKIFNKVHIPGTRKFWRWSIRCMVHILTNDGPREYVPRYSNKRLDEIVTVIAGILGVIILSMLIAFITTALEKMFYEFRKGRSYKKTVSRIWE